MINQVQTGLQTNSGSMGRWEIHAHQGRNIDSTTARRVGILSSPGTPATIGDGDNLERGRPTAMRHHRAGGPEVRPDNREQRMPE